MKKLVAVGVALSLGALLTLAWAWWSHPLPELRPNVVPKVRVLADGEEIAAVYEGSRISQTWVPIDTMPRFLIDAVLTAEDRRFFRHRGVDLRAAFRALLVNLKEAEVAQGASTITQQLARTLFLSSERTWARKLREAVLAVQIEMRHRKMQILEAYLNSVYMGHDGDVAVHGVAAAARHFLGKDLAWLRLDEAALLAGAIQAPNRVFAGDVARAQARRDIVLLGMSQMGLVPTAVAQAAMGQPLRRQAAGVTAQAPYFVELALAELGRRATLPPDNVEVTTTLDRSLQAVAETAIREGLARIERGRSREIGTLQASLIAIEPQTGRIRAVVGGRRYLESPFNRAIRARRQPGSLFKPIVYLSAFEADAQVAAGGLTPASLISDEPLDITTTTGTWSPQNMTGRFLGPVTVRRAVEESLNVPAVIVGQGLGPARVIATARALGIQSRLVPVPSLALGTSEVSLLEMTVAFATLANGGVRVHPTTLDTDADTMLTLPMTPLPPATRAVSAESAFLMTHLLRGVMARGTGASSARWGLHGVTAGKTGTTEGLRDAWFVGYTPDLVIGVWVGADDGSPVGLTGSEAALPIWATVMQAAVRKSRPSPFTPPAGIVLTAVDRNTGQAVPRWCPGAPTIEEAFRIGSEPPATCQVAAPTPADPVDARSASALPFDYSSSVVSSSSQR